MSREVRRVPLDFTWPLDQVWEGYIRPDSLNLPACPDCRYGGSHSSGYSPAAHAISSTFYPHQIVNAGAWPGADQHADRLAWHDKLGQAEVDNLIAEGRLRDCINREPTEDNPRTWEWVAVPRTAADVNAAQHGPDRMLGLHSHDAINHMILVRFRCQQLGIEMDCPTCKGQSDIGTDEQRAAAEAWEPSEPPQGEGWQLWETVSSGSPISPVFATADDLAGWMSDPDRGSDWVPAATAASFIAAGWAPSGISTPETGVVSGVEFIGHHSPSA